MENPVLVELQEYIIAQNSKEREPLRVLQTQTIPGTSLEVSDNSRPDFKWCNDETKLLIDLYAKYRKKIGSLKIKNQKVLWQKIAEELYKLGLFRVTPNNCMNKWRVLERNYKKFIDNENKTGRGRKYFEFEAEMMNIFEKKKNIHPEILLNSDTVHNYIGETFEEKMSIQTPCETPEIAPHVVSVDSPLAITPLKPSVSRRVRAIRKKTTTIEKIRLERKNYCDKKLEIENKKLEELKKRNVLITERNEIVKNFKCNCQYNSLL